jgi:UDP-3-O-acyl-N-acetylglucosamine deacetylase
MSACKTLEFTSPSLSFETASVKVHVLPRDQNREPRISWDVGGRLLYRTDHLKLFDSLDFEVRRTTIYRGESAALATPEHLAPVFLLWPEKSFDVVVDDGTKIASCDGANPVPEIPLMDGSALPFFLALRREAGVPEEIRFYDAPVNKEWDLRNPEGEPYGHVRIEPSETFEVEYRLDRPDVPGGFKSCAAISVYAPEDLYGVFQARTFILEKDYEQVRQAGLLAGATESCGLLVKTPTDKSLYRVAEEPAMHKILDLIGDLSFARPALPKVRIEILNGGHACHREILKQVLLKV